MSLEKRSLTFSDSRFGLRFRYPETTPQGHTTDLKEYVLDHAVRFHLVSEGSSEVYFEVSRLNDLSIEHAYDKMKATVEENLKAAVRPLTETTLLNRHCYETLFQWGEKERAVIFIAHESVLYRLLYNPASDLNLEILSTVEFH